jgi:hypothetical protein
MPTLWGGSGMVLELRVANLGPAVARDVSIELRLVNEDGAVQETRRQVEVTLQAGQDRRSLPHVGNTSPSLNDLAAMRLTLTCRVVMDGRPSSLLVLSSAARARDALEDKELRDGFYGGWALTRRDPVEDLHDVADYHKTIARAQDELRHDAQRDRLHAQSAARRASPSPPPNPSDPAVEASPTTRPARRRTPRRNP